MIPDQAATFDGQFRAGANSAYQADFAVQPRVVAPGQSLTQTSRFFAGAKEVRLLDRYTDDQGVAKLDYAIDWGWFRIVEKPIFYYLDWILRHVFNFGIAIILLWIGGRGDNAGVARRSVGLIVGLIALGIAVSGNGPQIGTFLAKLITG